MNICGMSPRPPLYSLPPALYLSGVGRDAVVARAQFGGPTQLSSAAGELGKVGIGISSGCGEPLNNLEMAQKLRLPGVTQIWPNHSPCARSLQSEVSTELQGLGDWASAPLNRAGGNPDPIQLADLCRLTASTKSAATG